MKTVRPQQPIKKVVKPQVEQLKIDETTNVATPTVPNVEVESIDKQGNKWVVYDEVDKFPLVLPQAVETPTKEERRQLIEEHTKLCQEEGLFADLVLPEGLIQALMNLNVPNEVIESARGFLKEREYLQAHQFCVAYDDTCLSIESKCKRQDCPLTQWKNFKYDIQVKQEPLNIETIMQETQQEIDSDKIKVEFTLTKRQYDLWLKRGGIRWLKQALLGRKLKK